MAEVTLHVYDVTNSGNVRANTAIMNLNKVMRGGIGLGGIFHGAVEVSLLCDYDGVGSFIMLACALGMRLCWNGYSLKFCTTNNALIALLNFLNFLGC